MLELLDACEGDQSGGFIESQEILLLRQNVLLGCTQDSENNQDRQYFEILHRAIVGATVKVWESEEHSVEQASVYTEWIFDRIASALWAAASRNPKANRELALQLFSGTASTCSSERRFGVKSEEKRFMKP
ncbi:hypothetical protein [Cupriavidus basilensis]